MILKQMAVGPIQANCYILGCEETLEAAVIDPGAESERILSGLAESKLTLKAIINTHGHFDHVGANQALKSTTGADLMIHSLDAPMLAHLSSSAAAFGLQAQDSPPPDRLLGDGDTITVGHLNLTVIHTPGHTQGGISILMDGCVFVGDTLFAGSVGRTDFPGGDAATLKKSIQQRLFPLGDSVKVYPGHMGPTSIGQERQHNPFVGERGVL